MVKIRTVYCYLGLWSVKIRTMSAGMKWQSISQNHDKESVLHAQRCLSFVMTTLALQPWSCAAQVVKESIQNIFFMNCALFVIFAKHFQGYLCNHIVYMCHFYGEGFTQLLLIA